MASVSIIYRKDKLNKKGEAPVHFRIIKDRKISYISTGFMIHKDFWDEEKNKVKSKHPHSKRIRSLIATKFAEVQDQVFEFDNNNKSVTSRKIRDEVYGKKPNGFFPFADSMIEEYYNKGGKYGTYNKNKSIIEKLRVYTKGRNLVFQDIDVDFLTKYEKYLRAPEGCKNKTNTILKDFRFLRRLFNDAYRQDIIEHKDIPFNKIEMKSEKTERGYLTEEELTKIEEFAATPGTRLDLHRDMFVFSSYVGGIRVSDILLMKWKQFDGTHVHFTTMKTTSQLSVKVPTIGLNILKKYQLKKEDKEAFVFPMLDNDLKTDNDVDVNKALSRATAYINKNLEIIETKLKLSKHISFHTSRHTWATRALRKGISIDKVSKILGHSAIKETQIYAKIVNSELDKAMDVFG